MAEIIKLTTNLCDITVNLAALNAAVSAAIKQRAIADGGIYKLEFTPLDGLIYTSIIEILELGLNDLFEYLHKGADFFSPFALSPKLVSVLTRYIRTYDISDDVWSNLTSTTDLNYATFQTRRLPYFNVNDKDWQQANISAVASSYAETLEQKSATPVKKPAQTAAQQTATDATQDDTKQHETAARKSEHDVAAVSTVEPSAEYLPGTNKQIWQALDIVQYDNLTIQASHIALLVKLSMPELAAEYFCYLMINPYTCHIVQNTELMQLFDLKNKRLASVLCYAYTYAMYMLRQEETTLYSNTTMKHRFAFTLERARELPVFDTYIEQNPYVLQLTGSTMLHKSCPFYIPKQRRILSRAEFERRFHNATGGAFRGVDMKHYEASITGSILIPCVHESPLESRFREVQWDTSRLNKDMGDAVFTPEDEVFVKYLSYYYPGYESLTDEAYAALTAESSDEPYCQEERVIDMSDVAAALPNADEPQAPPGGPSLAPRAKYVFALDNAADKDNNKVEYNQLADIDVSITTTSHQVFRKRAFEMFNQIKANVAHRGPAYIKEIKTLSGFKFSVYGTGLTRPIDIFYIPYSPAKMVKKFHLHCVKMYYDGDVYMYRSCVAALISGVNDYYTWFSCRKIPFDVIAKYAMRGISCILNRVEHTAIISYLKTDSRWGELMKKLGMEYEEMFSIVEETHPFFMAGDHNAGVRMGLRPYASAPTINKKLTHRQCAMPRELCVKAGSIINPPSKAVIIQHLSM
jgi:hypothetical protein